MLQYDKKLVKMHHRWPSHRRKNNNLPHEAEPFLGELTVAQLVQKTPAPFRTQRFIVPLGEAASGHHPEQKWIHYTLSQLISVRSILILSLNPHSHLSSSPHVLQLFRIKWIQCIIHNLTWLIKPCVSRNFVICHKLLYSENCLGHDTV